MEEEEEGGLAALLFIPWSSLLASSGHKIILLSSLKKVTQKDDWALFKQVVNRKSLRTFLSARQIVG